jgi:hypothetical protein
MASVGCRNALDNNPNIFLSSFLYLFILFPSDNLQTCTKYLREFFLIFIYFIRPENLFFRTFIIRRHFGRCLPNGFAVGGEFLAPVIIDVIVPVGSICG